MDPLTIVATVASIGQLAQAALTLSKTLYNVGSTIASASDDIKTLADDLKTFSQSLSLLSRLLEDSKAWYADDVYLLTAKIIKDCAELYVKIDKILVKLGGNGKSNWKFRVKFVYKESQIKKLMTRLRDMKGTLATILMSLQVDLQLSLLNISSPSKIQRSAEKPLHPETIQTLKDAQIAVEAGGILPRYAAYANDIACAGEKELDVLAIDCQKVKRRETPTASIGSPVSSEDLAPSEPKAPISSIIQPYAALDMSANLMMLPARVDETQPLPAREIESIMKTDVSSTKLTEGKNSFSIKTIETPTSPQKLAGSINFEHTASRSLKSASSSESFKSAMSVQASNESVASQIKAVQGVMHAFQTALETLESLIAKRILASGIESYPAANALKMSLREGRGEIEQRNIYHCKRRGHDYVQCFTKSHSTRLESISLLIMRKVVTPLHIYSADHEELESSSFDTLRRWSERCRIRTINLLDSAELLAGTDPHETDYWPEGNSLVEPISDLCHFPRDRSESPKHYLNNLPVKNFSKKTPESHLPFIGYTFKRFTSTFERDIVPSIDIGANQLSTDRLKAPQRGPGMRDAETVGNIRVNSGNPIKPGKPESSGRLEASGMCAESGPEVRETIPQQQPTINPKAQESTSTSPESPVRLNTEPTDSCALSPSADFLPSTLWQVALNTLQDTAPETFASLQNELKCSLGFNTAPLAYNASPGFCKNLSCIVKGLQSNVRGNEMEWKEVVAMRENIIKVILTVDEQLGLQVATIGWSCVYALLAIHEPTFSSGLNTASPETTQLIIQSVTQLQDVEAIIARYAVMENLYSQSGGSLSLRPDYQSSLLSLCITILQYFEIALVIARNATNPKESKNGEDAVTGMERSVLAEKIKMCEELVKSIKEKNLSCQGFRVVVETKEESEDGSDVSDEDWEKIQSRDCNVWVGDDGA